MKCKDCPASGHDEATESEPFGYDYCSIGREDQSTCFRNGEDGCRIHLKTIEKLLNKERKNDRIST